MPVQVSLNTNANPPVTVQPQIHDVNRGNQTIKWERASNQTFTFTSLSGLPNPPFSNLSVSGSEISVVDNNQNNGPDVYYPYTIVVTLNGVQYSSAVGGITDQSTGPTVKNK
ncbi:MAG: hypothetical protein ACYC7G_06440 [Rudaea sp.]